MRCGFCGKQLIITTHEQRLADALRKRQIKIVQQYCDNGVKHIDIRIEWAGIDIEVDGKQHLLNGSRLFSDIERADYSSEDGFTTIHISNDDIDKNLEKLANSIADAARKHFRSAEEDEDDSDWF